MLCSDLEWLMWYCDVGLSENPKSGLHLDASLLWRMWRIKKGKNSMLCSLSSKSFLIKIYWNSSKYIWVKYIIIHWHASEKNMLLTCVTLSLTFQSLKSLFTIFFHQQMVRLIIQESLFKSHYSRVIIQAQTKRSQNYCKSTKREKKHFKCKVCTFALSIHAFAKQCCHCWMLILLSGSGGKAIGEKLAPALQLVVFVFSFSHHICAACGFTSKSWPPYQS